MRLPPATPTPHVDAADARDVIQDTDVGEDRPPAPDAADVRARSPDLDHDPVDHVQMPQRTGNGCGGATEGSQQRMALHRSHVGGPAVAAHDEQGDVIGDRIVHHPCRAKSGGKDARVDRSGHGPELEPVETGELMAAARREVHPARDVKRQQLGPRVVNTEGLRDAHPSRTPVDQFTESSRNGASGDAFGCIDKCMQRFQVASRCKADRADLCSFRARFRSGFLPIPRMPTVAASPSSKAFTACVVECATRSSRSKPAGRSSSATPRWPRPPRSRLPWRKCG
jgi:hypothetical protein